jgi:hypothetical protein
MATQVKDAEIEITEPVYAFERDGQPQTDGKERTAWDQIGHLCGKYRDDPYVREVYDRVLANRRKDRIGE